MENIGSQKINSEATAVDSLESHGKLLSLEAPRTYNSKSGSGDDVKWGRKLRSLVWICFSPPYEEYTS